MKNKTEIEEFVDYVTDYCKKAVKTLDGMKKDSFDKVGHGLSDGGLYGFLAFAQQQQSMYGFEIPNVLRVCLEEYQKENK